MSAASGTSADPPRWPRWLIALWLSLSAHAALLAWVGAAPPVAQTVSAISFRLVTPAPLPPPAQPPAQAIADDVTATLPQVDASVPSGPADREADREPEPEPDPAAAPSVQAASPPAAAPAPPAASPAPDSSVNSAVDLVYYRSREVDQLPAPQTPVAPAYPAAVAGRAGTVRVELWLEADGRVNDAQIVASDPAGVFDAAVLDAFGTPRYTPAVRAGRAVRSRIVVEVRFEPPRR